MLLLMNVGNTNTQLADVDDDGSIGNIRYLETSAFDPALLAPDADLAIATVVPEIQKVLLPDDDRVTYVGAFNAPLINFSVVDSTTLGADRVANAVELAAGGDLPGVVIDFGTAITFEAVDEDRNFRGGAILPGRKLWRRSLHKWTRLLPELPWGANAPQTAGVNTLAAMRLGVDRGVIGAVREIMNVLRNQFGAQVRFVGVGGDSEFFLKELPEIAYGGEDFTLRGIKRIYEAVKEN